MNGFFLKIPQKHDTLKITIDDRFIIRRKKWIAMRKILATLMALCLVLAAIPLAMSAAALTTKTYTFNDLQGYYQSQGRVEVVDGALNMDTSSSGFEWYFYGSGDVVMGADIKCTYTTNMFFTVIVDGVRTRLEADTGVKTSKYMSLTLASGLTEGYHHIEVYKQTEASSALVTVWGVTFTGTPMAAPAEDKITMEVVGDSISGGASNLTTNTMPSPQASYPMYQDGTQTYAYLTGEALSADVRVTQTSGFGCVGGWNAQGKDLNLQDMYPYTSYWRDHSDAGLYDFNPPADIAVINLGTNDATASSHIGLTNAEFKAGAINLMQMTKQKNNGAPVVWCTGMMGVKYQTELTAAVNELGGAAAGYYFLILPTGMSGGENHPNVAEHQAAATVLTEFLLENCLPSSYKADFATATDLQAALTAAQAVSSPSAALEDAMLWAQIELSCQTTDGYRLGLRVKALEDAMNGYVTGLDLMPIKGVTEEPKVNGHYVWPSYGTGLVTLYKGGEGEYWPHLHTEYSAVVDMDVTPYLTLETQSNAEWNVHIAYYDGNGIGHTVTATDIAGEGAVNFAPDITRKTITVDFGAYLKNAGHTDANGCVRIVGCDLYVVGATDTFVTFFTCALTDNSGVKVPTAITGNIPVANGVVGTVAEGTNVSGIIDSMDNAEYLRVVDKNGNAASGVLATGMKLQLVVDGAVVDEAIVAVLGDITGDGTIATDDAREALRYTLGAVTFSDAQQAAADYDKNGEHNTADARDILRASL